MTPQRKRIELILKLLEEYFPLPSIPLNHKDPFTLLVAVVLSARCTDAKVNQITPLLFAKACTPQALAKMPIDEVQKIIRPCGLSPAKAKALVHLSQIIVKKYKGRVPQNLRSLKTLPGVGHKTASVVMAQAFNQAAFPIDTHIHRLAMRWGLSSGKNVQQTEKDLKKQIPKALWNKAHLQIIYYARKYCPARGHKIEKCPICSALKNL